VCAAATGVVPVCPEIARGAGGIVIYEDVWDIVVALTGIYPDAQFDFKADL
jgi:hypothetical protein